jgi:hypothetical protein
MFKFCIEFIYLCRRGLPSCFSEVIVNHNSLSLYAQVFFMSPVISPANTNILLSVFLYYLNFCCP